MKISIHNETDPLASVILGIAEDMGAPLDINPVSKSHIEKGTYPNEADLIRELADFEMALTQAHVNVLRPRNIKGVEQIFCRDIGFVIDDTFVISNMKEPVRQQEFPGIIHHINTLDQSKVLSLNSDTFIEGGDVVLHDEHVFVGISSRTNRNGFEALKKHFPGKQIHPIPIKESLNPDEHILHLDCTFQPVSNGYCIIYEEGFIDIPQIIDSLFPSEKRIKVSQKEKSLMFPNVFSISPDLMVIERSFESLKKELNRIGVHTISVEFSENSKLSGLLRCATLPLLRHKKSGR